VILAFCNEDCLSFFLFEIVRSKLRGIKTYFFGELKILIRKIESQQNSVVLIEKINYPFFAEDFSFQSAAF